MLAFDDDVVVVVVLLLPAAKIIVGVPVATTTVATTATATDSSWRAWSGRTAGPDRYRFGDVTRGIMGSLL